MNTEKRDNHFISGLKEIGRVASNVSSGKDASGFHLTCKECGGAMRKSSESKSSGMGCLLIIISFVLFWFFPIGTIIAIFLFLYGLHVGTKRRGLWVCKQCGRQVERQRKWYEMG